MTAPFIDITRTVFPILALDPERSDQAARPDFFGTAFCVGPGIFMTAAHVVDEARQRGALALGGPASGEGQPMGVARVQDVETWPERDVALLRCNAEATRLGTWLVNRVQLLTDLSAFGYPHAITQSPAGDRLNVIFRSYKGYVITTRGFERLPGEPAVYEISCPFPQGMSGAPVLLNVETQLIVVGIVLGVSTVTYGGVEQNVGIAMMGDEILPLESRLLGGRIAAQLDLSAVELRRATPDEQAQ